MTTENKSVSQNDAQTHVLDPLGDGISSLELIRVSGSDLDIVNAARVSYGKTSTTVTDRDKTLIAFLMKHEHTSPFEHNQLSFRVKCPLFIARQWMRHRMNSYNEISYRYAKAEEQFYVPTGWRTQDKINKQASGQPFTDQQLEAEYRASIAQAHKTYLKLLQSGVCRELARGLLPLCTYTQFIYTCNLHSLMHFLKLRLSKDAQIEIMVYAQGLLQLALPHFPIALGAWKEIHEGHLQIPQTALPTLEQTLDL